MMELKPIELMKRVEWVKMKKMSMELISFQSEWKHSEGRMLPQMKRNSPHGTLSPHRHPWCTQQGQDAPRPR